MFGLDALLFRTPWFVSVLQPDSSTALFEWTLWREKNAQARYGDNLVISVGDSRLAYAPRLCNEITGETGYAFRSAGVAGSDARTWYYMLRALDPSANRYRAVVIGLNSYSDRDENDTDDDIRALHYTIARLRLTEAFDFARTFHSRELQWRALRGALLKGLVYKTDLLQFLENPRARIRTVKFQRANFELWTSNFMGDDINLVGIEIDWKTLKLTLPAGATENQRNSARDFLAHRLPAYTGRLAAFRRLWLGRIVDHYRNSRTKIIFIRLARGALVPPVEMRANDAEPSSIHDLAKRPNVALADPDAFDSLERPELFGDGLHLNRAGAAVFSPMLARTVAALLGPPR